MNRNFENRKPTKVYANTKENQMIIKTLNMYGRVPETWELLEEIERLNNIINELENKLLELRLTDVDGKTIVYRLLDKLQELKGSDKE